MALNSGTILVSNGHYLLSAQINVDKSLTIQSVNGPGTNTSEVIFEFLADETYHIAVAGKTASDVGNIVLNYEIIPEPMVGIWIIGLLELWIIGRRKGEI